MYIYFQAMKIHSLFITINALLQAIVASYPFQYKKNPAEESLQR